MPTALWTVRAQLVTMFGQIDGVVVFDGPMTRTTPPERFLLVGTDGGDAGLGEERDDGATADQVRSTLSGDWRDETGEVVCAAWAWSGATDFAPLRAASKTIVDAAETLVRADRTLDGVVTAPGLAEVTSFRLREWQTAKGAVVRVAFTVSYGALITT